MVLSTLPCAARASPLLLLGHLPSRSAEISSNFAAVSPRSCTGLNHRSVRPLRTKASGEETSTAVVEDAAARKRIEEPSFLMQSSSEEENAPLNDLFSKLNIKVDSEDAYTILFYGSGALIALWVSAAIASSIDSLPVDGLKPIQVAALQGNREAVEVVLSLTSPIPSVSNWSTEGLIEFMQSETRKDQACCMKEAEKSKSASLPKTETIEAIDLYPSEATLLSNTSLCWIRLGQGEYALADAKACRALWPDWVKACYREGAALRLLQRFDEESAFYEDVKLDPNNKELVDAFRTVEAGRKFHGTDKRNQ